MTESKYFDYVHPVAEIFPMLGEDELALLAEDIKANGQTDPIILTDVEELIEGAVVQRRVLIDGRNRLRACEIAGVEPRFEMLDGIDPVAFIMSKNVNRRHMSKGAVAMSVAMALPDSEEVGGRGKKCSATEQFPIVSRARLSEARTVLRYAPALAEKVLRSEKSLAEAYDLARERKAEEETDNERIAAIVAEAPDLAELAAQSLPEAEKLLAQRRQDAARLKTIEADAPDLVAQVHEKRLSVAEALAACEARRRERENEQRGATEMLSRVVGLLDVSHTSPTDMAKQLMEKLNTQYWPAERRKELSPEYLKACGEVFSPAPKSSNLRRNEMAKPRSIKQLALDVTTKVYDGFVAQLQAESKEHDYDTGAARLMLDTWIERVSNVPIEDLRSKQPGELVCVPGYAREHLASDLLIVKEYRNGAASALLCEGHDRRRTSNVDFEELFTPSLFAELDYARQREKDIILGESQRVTIADATPEQWRLMQDVETQNWERQEEARKKQVRSARKCNKLFAQHPDCKNTDQLMKKLHGWKPKA